MTVKSSHHNDIALGFPFALPTTTSKLETALWCLIDAGACGGGDSSNYDVARFTAESFNERLTCPAHIPKNLRGCFEIVSSGEHPIYLLWRMNHADIDAMSMLAFLEQLRGSILQDTPRWTTPRELMKSPVAAFSQQLWLDTAGEPLEIPIERRSPRETSILLGAAFAVALARSTGRHDINLGFISVGRPSSDPVVPGNALKVIPARCILDIEDAHGNPSLAIDRAAATIRDSLGSPIYLPNEVAETVDILVNTQTLNWHATACSILGGSIPNLEFPVIYHQVTDESSQIRIDIELWDPSAPHLRVRNRTITPELTRIVTDALALCTHSAPPLQITAGNRRTYQQFAWYVSESISCLDHELAAAVHHRAALIQRIDQRYALGFISEQGDQDFVNALSCMTTGRVCHFLGDDEAPYNEIDAAARKLGVPVAIFTRDGIKYIEPHLASRSVADDAKRGWAYIVSSGSTGKPKVTLLTNAMSTNIIGNAGQHLDITQSSRIAMISSAKFDAFYFECLITLLTKKPPFKIKSVAALINGQVDKTSLTNCTHMVATPTVLSLLLGKEIPLTGTIMSVGERLPNNLLSKIEQQQCQVFDLYGPSEAGIWSGLRDASQQEAGFRPIDNVYFRRGKSYGGNRHEVHIGLAASIYGTDALDVYSGDSATFPTDLNRIKNIRRSDGLIKIGGRRVPITKISDQLQKRHQFDLDTIVEVDSIDNSNYQTFAALMIVDSELEESVESTMLLGAEFTLYRISEPPLSPTGKLDIPHLLARFKLKQTEVTENTEAHDIAAKISQVWKRHTGSSDPEKKFADLKGSSLDALRIQIELSRDGIKVPLPEQLTTLTTLVQSARSS